MFCTRDFVVDVYNKMLERSHLNLCTTQYVYVDFKHFLQGRKEWIVLITSIHPSFHFIVCVCVSVCLWSSASDWIAYQILVIVRIGVHYRKLSCKLEFHENLHIDSHTLLKGMSTHKLFVTELSEKWYRRSLWNAVELLWASLKWCSTSCTLCINDSFQHFGWFGYSLV